MFQAQKIAVIIGFLLGLSYFFSPVLAQITAEKPNDVTINATVKGGDYIQSNLYFQNATISFGSPNKVCPNMNCSLEFRDTTFNEFGRDRIMSGTLKVEDTVNSTPNLKSFVFYILSGTFHLVRSLENLKTGEQVLFYTGQLGFDPEDAIFTPELQYDSMLKLSDNNLELTGNKTST